MYSQSYDMGGWTVLWIVLLILYIVAWVLTMQIVTKAAEDKGYYFLNGKLWFIGLFGLIFTPAIIVAALPDKKSHDRTKDVAPTTPPTQIRPPKTTSAKTVSEDGWHMADL